ncbi:MAG: biosynthetic-type acetolactate synthase large subunit [Lentisphaeria bacterium]|nr:biosynthetic-type acetolactate synthase large subunit [Lentisphaeria bacterium]
MKSSNQHTDKTLKGAEIVARTLEKIGVDVIFAYPGGQALELHQALSHSNIRLVLPRHEQGGAFAAGGYARISGKTGCCLATSGPGATNLITGIADAYMDSIPVVFITGQVGLSFIGKNAFQETDIIGVTRPLVKHSFLVMDVNDIPSILFQAFKLAGTGRPGPVLVDIPKNIQQARTVPVYPKWEEINDARQTPPPVRNSEIDMIRKAIKRAKSPCVYAGGGIIMANAAEELREFAHAFNIPVATTLMGMGAFPPDDPLSLRWLGMHGTYAANYAVNKCDLLLAFGTRFDDRVTGPVNTFAQDAFIIHVDVDRSEINKNKRADLGIVADIKEVLTELNKNPLRQNYNDWFARINEWKNSYPFKYKDSSDDAPPKPQYILEELHRLTHGEAVIVPGVGQHQMWAAQFYQYKSPRQFLTSGGLGAMGFGLPAAMGAKVAAPDQLVINVDGDGSFQMNIQELATLVAEKIPVKMVILNNQHLGMVAQWEDRFYGSNHCCTILKHPEDNNSYYPDFVTIAKGYGIPGKTVNSRKDVTEAIREMLDHDGPYLLDCRTGYEEHVLPMIPPGCSYKDILTE